MSRLNSTPDVSPVKQLANDIATNLRNRGNEMVPANFSSGVLSMESMQGNDLKNMQAMSNTLSSDLKEIFASSDSDRFAKMSSQQIEAAVITAAAYSQPKEFSRVAKNISMEGLQVPAGSNIHGTLNFRENKDAFVSMEAFDNMELQKGIDVSVVFNALAVGQSPFNDQWFPAVIGTPDEAVFKISIPRILVQNEYISPNQSGDPANFRKMNLIRAALDYTVLLNNSTDLVPIVRADNANIDKFVDAAAVAPWDETVGAVKVKTSALRIGVEHSLIALSSNEELKLAGAIGETDAVEPKVSLKDIFLAVTKGTGGAAVTSVLKFRVKNFPKAGFTKPMEGNVRDMRLTFETSALRIKTDKKDVANATPAALADLIAAGYQLDVSADISGKLNLEFSNEKLFAADSIPAAVMDEDGKPVDMGATDVKAILDALSFEVIGYTLDARRSNSNLRTKGLILNPDMETRPYYVPLNAPLVSQTPINQESMGLDLNALIQGVHMQIENNAVTTLLEFDATLKDWYVSSETINLYPTFEAPGELLVAPFYQHLEIDMSTALNSTSSANKVNDIQGVLASTIREVVARMARETGYEVALRANNSGTVEPSNVIAVTDLVLPKYLITSGDDRYLGLGTTFEVSSVNDLRMRNTIFLSYGRKGSGKHDPLTFGNMLYIPELAISAQVNRNGATILERQVQPRFRHICNLPILVRIDVKNLEAASQSAAIYHTKETV